MQEWVAILVAIVVAILFMAATVYVHIRLPIHTQNAAATRLVRLLLVGVGVLGVYLGAAWTAGESGILRAAAMVCGFGVVHFPAFVVLYIKRLRGEYDSG